MPLRPPKPASCAKAPSACEDELAELSDRYRQLVDLSPDGIALLTRGRITFINPEGLRLLGAAIPEQVLGKEVLGFVHPDSRDEVANSIGRIEREGEVVRHRERKLLRVDGSSLEVETAAAMIVVGDESTTQVVFRDISEQRAQERALRESEETFRALVEHTDDIVARLDAEGRCLYVNPAVYTIFGISPSELIGKSYQEIGLPEEQARRWEVTIRSVFETARQSQEEAVVATMAGPRVFHCRLTPERDGGGHLRTVLCTLHDVTAARQAQEALGKSLADLRRLSDRLEHVREEERTEIAREIHDQLGQALTSLKLDTTWLERKVRAGITHDEQGAELSRLGEMRQLLDEAQRSVRRIATELRPPILDDLGLVAAVEWQAQQFTQRTGIPVAVTARDGVPSSAAANLALFRVLQECLTNVARHSLATDVVVDLSDVAGSVVLTVRDNGCGFDPAVRSKGSLGMIGMRERVEQLGGLLSVESTLGRGTTVRASVPT